jgi:hypothetical protein
MSTVTELDLFTGSDRFPGRRRSTELPHGDVMQHGEWIPIVVRRPWCRVQHVAIGRDDSASAHQTPGSNRHRTAARYSS